MLALTTSVASASSPPAGGAALGQVFGATLGATLATVALLWLFTAHRSGRVKWLGRVAAWAERETGVPAWSALPGLTLGASLLTAVFGMYWDISIHIDNGRDAGPLANPAHYFILVGLFGVLFSGILSAALTTGRPSPTARRLPNGWWAPLGSLMIVACGTVSLVAFPLDDMWHRLFGQDVTLWGPTHLLLIGGASFSILGQWVLQREGEQANRARSGDGQPLRGTKRGLRAARFRDWALAGSLLVGLSTFQAEFDFGVPQFRMVWQPLLLALAASLGLVAARLRLGPGGALGAAAFFVVLRGGLALIVGPILGQTTPHFPLYLTEAGLVELVAMRYGRDRPITLGAVAGLLVGTVGFAAEYLWQSVDAYLPWTSSLVVEGLVCATIAGVAGGVLGGAVGRAVTGEGRDERVPRGLVAVAGVTVVAVMAWALPMPAPSQPVVAAVSLSDVGTAPGHREVAVTARLTPPDAARDARWFSVTAWQGGGAVVAPMERVAAGVYRSARPVPAWGAKWKSTLRLQTGRSVLAMPIYLPADPAIPVAGVPAPARFTRTFVEDRKVLQREQKPDVPGGLQGAAYVVVALVWSAMIAVVAWGLTQLDGEGRRTRRPRRRRRATAPTSPAVS
jgi:hypothetical protein